MIIQHNQIDNRAMVCCPERGLRGPTRFQRKRLKRLVVADSVAAAEISGDESASCEPIIIKSSQGDNCETPGIAGKALQRHACSTRHVAEMSGGGLCAI